MDTNKLSATDSLEIITNMIEARKANWNNNGHILRMWGFLVLAASIGHYLLSLFGLYNYIWAAWSLTIIGAIYTPIYYSKYKKRFGESSFLDKISGFIWWTFAFNAFAFGFGLTWIWGHITTGLILVLLGVVAAIDGKLMRFPAMIWGGIITNIIGVFALVWIMLVYRDIVHQQDFLILLVGVGIVLTNLIPGFILKRAYKTKHNG